MPISIAAAVISIGLSPMSGSSTRPPTVAPRIEPRVLEAYTQPIAFSPDPLFSKARVISGRVMPAQKVAGIMMTRHKPYFARVKPI